MNGYKVGDEVKVGSGSTYKITGFHNDEDQGQQFQGQRFIQTRKAWSKTIHEVPMKAITK